MKNRVTIDMLRTQPSTAPIWALNGTADLLGQMGELHLGVPKEGGARVDPLVVYATWLPTNLTDQVPRNQLLSASEFLKAVSSGAIVLIEAAQAASMLKEDGADEERERLDQQINAAKRNLAARLQADRVDIVRMPDQEDASSPAPTVRPDFAAFAESLSSKSDIAALNVLRTRGTLTSVERKYVRSKIDADTKPKCWAFLSSVSPKRRA